MSAAAAAGASAAQAAVSSATPAVSASSLLHVDARDEQASSPSLTNADHADQQQQDGETTVTSPGGATLSPKRLHVSNIPFRFREADLRALLGVSFVWLSVVIKSENYPALLVTLLCF